LSHSTFFVKGFTSSELASNHNLPDLCLLSS
jgi:hypothetical protein